MRRYHHIGIPTTEAKPGETHLKHLKVFDVSHEKSEFGEERMRFGEAQLRRVCAQRGLDWDRLSEDQREAFVDDLLHEK